ncbi:MAG TPA: LptE family protein [Candidatus Deferrimicrobium sp.]|nr:LptE family protein [Candidatus Deferrimicrobium sp.]
MMSVKGWTTIIGAACVGASGCGVYTFNPRGQSTIKSVAVERFENQTAEYGLADRMTDVIIDALIADGNLKVVSAENADAILRGTLTRYERKPYQFDQSDVVESYSIDMDFEISLTGSRDETEIWKERLSQRGVYEMETETEEMGRQRAIEQLVVAIINKTTKSW